MNALIALERVRLQRGSSPWLGLALALLVAAGGIAARHASGDSSTIETTLDLGLSHLLAYLLPYLFCSGMISEDVRARTLAFLTSRPVSRVQIVLAKWVVGTGACAALLLSTCLLLHVGCYLMEPAALFEALPQTLLTALALALQAGAYVALGLFYGALRPSAASGLFAFHLLFLEAGLSMAPGSLRLLSWAHHSAELAGLPRHGVLSEGVQTLPSYAHLSVLLAVIALILALAVLGFTRTEYRTSQHD